MSKGLDTLLATERRLLRGRLQAQRQSIAERLGSAPAARNDFPRSITMRLLTRHPLLARRVLVGIASGLLAVIAARKRRPAATTPARALPASATASAPE